VAGPVVSTCGAISHTSWFNVSTSRSGALPLFPQAATGGGKGGTVMFAGARRVPYWG
jgi:hypothetical protein